MPRVAVIDDEPQIADAIERLLQDRFEIFKFNDPTLFVEFLKQNSDAQLSVIISDQKMPRVTGTDLLSHSLAYQPNATRILLTGYSELDSIVAAINEGHVYRYLHKPWEPTDLVSTVTEAARKYQLIIDNQAKSTALEAANHELKSLDHAKNQFMVLINHELKTPLTGILSYLELLKESGLDPNQLKYLDQIESNSQRLYKMIQDSLLIVSAEAKLVKAVIQRFDPKTNLDLTLSTEFESLVNKKALEVEIVTGNKTWIGDPKLISQILRRLLENAVRFAEPNTRVELSTSVTASHRSSVKVCNIGPPIPGEALQNLGKPFYIAEDILKHTQGTGLGLSVVVSLLKLHGINLNLQNVKNGVEASFVLPTLN